MDLDGSIFYWFGGALVLYAVGLYGGRPLVERWGKVLRVGPTDLDRAEGWFNRFGVQKTQTLTRTVDMRVFPLTTN